VSNENKSKKEVDRSARSFIIIIINFDHISNKKHVE
jgi:hypothetical protein